MIFKRISILVVTLGLCCSAWAQIQAPPPAVNIDPYERFNRMMFGFNEVVDGAVLRPLATLYNKVIPNPISKAISNFFSNIDNIPTILNDLLQGNFYQTTSDIWRLGINTTVGILGFIDVASWMGLEPNLEDLGLTLARWGYTNSSYLVIPFLGPSTVRDAIAWPINYEFMTIYPYINPPITRYEIYFTGVVVRRADMLHFNNVFQQAAIDKYIFMRNAYLQHRAYLIERNEELGDPYLEKNNKIEKKSSA